jgi:undecaprenyl diphosphate synthase
VSDQQTFAQKRQVTADRLGIHPDAIPRHIAIIMDGNGRWAQQRGLPRMSGHEQGGKAVQVVAQHCVDIGIEYLTLYSFSMQNWKRPEEEVGFLMHLIAAYLEGIRSNLMRDNVRLLHLGRRERLPQMMLDALDETIEITGVNTGMVLGLALNYGSREEIVDAAKAIAQKCCEGKLKPDDIDEACIAGHLNTAGWRDPDLVVRTSGEMRISNFLLWQISYAEFYVTETFWPDFSPAELEKAVLAYAARNRRFGDINAVKPQ